MPVSLQHLTMLPSSMMNAAMSPDSPPAGFWTTLNIITASSLGPHHALSRSLCAYAFPQKGLCNVRRACIMHPAMQRHTGFPSQQELATASRVCEHHRHTESRALERIVSRGDNDCAASKNGQYTLMP